MGGVNLPPVVAAIDPGKSGYVCALNIRQGDGNPDHVVATGPHFWPTPVTTVSEGVDDGFPRYEIPAMFALLQGLHRDGCRLLVLEEQRPRAHGPKGATKEGTLSSWSNGYGFGLWEGLAVAAGFKKAKDESEAKFMAVTITHGRPAYLIVPPDLWKRRMGATVVSHRGEDSHHARRKAANARTIEVAKRVDPRTDFRALERKPGAKTDSPDKAAAFLLAVFGLRGVLGVVDSCPKCSGCGKPSHIESRSSEGQFCGPCTDENMRKAMTFRWPGDPK